MEIPKRFIFLVDLRLWIVDDRYNEENKFGSAVCTGQTTED